MFYWGSVQYSDVIMMVDLNGSNYGSQAVTAANTTHESDFKCADGIRTAM